MQKDDPRWLMSCTPFADTSQALQFLLSWRPQINRSPLLEWQACVSAGDVIESQLISLQARARKGMPSSAEHTSDSIKITNMNSLAAYVILSYAHCSPVLLCQMDRSPLFAGLRAKRVDLKLIFDSNSNHLFCLINTFHRSI